MNVAPGCDRILRLPLGNDLALGIENFAGPSRVPRTEDVVGRTHAVGPGGVVLENDLDRIADLRAQNRSQQAQVFVLGRARLTRCECTVGILPVDRLAIDVPDVVWSRLGVRRCCSFKRFAGHHIDPERRIVPFGLFGRNVVGAHVSARRGGILLRTRSSGSRSELGQTSDSEKANRPYQAFHANLLPRPFRCVLLSGWPPFRAAAQAPDPTSEASAGTSGFFAGSLRG